MRPLEPHSGDLRNAILSGTAYDVVGATTWWNRHRAVAIDFGISAYVSGNTHLIPRKAVVVGGQIRLGIDPFDYFERLAKLRGAPPLIYDWRVTGLWQQSAPWIPDGQRAFKRDEQKLAWSLIKATNAYDDDGGHADYLIRARPLGAPRHNLALRCR